MDEAFSLVLKELAQLERDSLSRHGAIGYDIGDGEYIAYLGRTGGGIWWAWVYRNGVDYGKCITGGSEGEVKEEAMRRFSAKRGESK